MGQERGLEDRIKAGNAEEPPARWIGIEDGAGRVWIGQIEIGFVLEFEDEILSAFSLESNRLNKGHLMEPG